jgi:hypothetical protein
VLTTHSVLPPSSRPDLTQSEAVLTLELTERRVDAGMMSCSASRRSYNVSSGCSDAMLDVSDSVSAERLAHCHGREGGRESCVVIGGTAQVEWRWWYR